VVILGDLLDGKVIQASKERIVILKNSKQFEVKFDDTTIKEINKHQ